MQTLKKTLILLIFLSSLAFANLYNKQAALNDISSKLPKMSSIKCKFKQEKYLKNIQNPIISGGDFEYIQNKGVYFYTKYPVESTTNFTNEKYKQINDIVNAISNKKYSKLDREFNFYYAGDISNWSLGLKPKQSSDAFKFINSITIEGMDYINKISINQTNGNKTLIWFKK